METIIPRWFIICLTSNLVITITATWLFCNYSIFFSDICLCTSWLKLFENHVCLKNTYLLTKSNIFFKFLFLLHSKTLHETIFKSILYYFTRISLSTYVILYFFCSLSFWIFMTWFLISSTRNQPRLVLNFLHFCCFVRIIFKTIFTSFGDTIGTSLGRGLISFNTLNNTEAKTSWPEMHRVKNKMFYHQVPILSGKYYKM